MSHNGKFKLLRLRESTIGVTKCSFVSTSVLSGNLSMGWSFQYSRETFTLKVNCDLVEIEQQSVSFTLHVITKYFCRLEQTPSRAKWI